MTSDSPFFSIVIPTYNRAHLIGRAIESVLGQTFKDWELIIVDDGSTDDTCAKVLAFQDKRIRYVWQENAGRSAARNHGILLSKGQYVCFQDSDDWYRLNHFSAHYEALVTSGLPNLAKTTLVIHTDGGEVYSKHSERCDYYSLGVASAFTCFSIKRAKLDFVKFDPKFFVGEDLHFLARLTIAEVVHLIDRPTVECQESNLFGANGLLTKDSFREALTNKIECFLDIVAWNRRNNLSSPLYFKKEIILAGCFRLGLSMKYRAFGFVLNDLIFIGKAFLKFPYAGFLFLKRFAFVKSAEVLGTKFEGGKRF